VSWRHAEENPEEPEAPVVVRAWELRGAQTRKELSGRVDKLVRWKSLQERRGVPMVKTGEPDSHKKSRSVRLGEAASGKLSSSNTT
jgi:hypothetical protein